MAETLVKNPFCSKCGEDARPQALFCHACGGEIIDLPKENEENVSSAWFKSEIVDDPEDHESPSAAATELKKIEDSEESPAVDGGVDEEKVEDVPRELDKAVDDPGIQVKETLDKSIKVKPKNDENAEAATASKGQKLKSAAELRRRPKPVLTKRIEVVWEERPESPNLLFLLFGLLLALLAGGAFFLAFYLK